MAEAFPGTPPVMPMVGIDMAVPIPTLDNQAAGASEQPDAELHVDPYDAAKSIRRKTRSLREAVTRFQVAIRPPTSASTNAHAHLDRATRKNKLALGQLTSARTKANETFNRADKIVHMTMAGSQLWYAIDARRAAEAKKLLNECKDLAIIMRSDASEMYGYVENGQINSDYTQQSLGQLFNLLGSELQTETPTPDNSDQIEKTRNQVQKICDEIHVLAQGLPTIPNAPVEKNQMILRAIATILKNGGLLDTSVTTEKEHVDV